MDTTAGHRVAGIAEMFALGGEMGALMRTIDWSATPVGPVEQWPQSLRTAVSICLASRFPMFVWWGPQLNLLYNDGYRTILGAKHPRSMGQPGLECWAEIRDIIGPMLTRVMQAGEATWSEDQFLLVERNGFVEESYFTFSYSPIFDENGGVGGVFTAVTETTARVVGERRMRTLRELAAGTAQARSVEETCSLAMATLAKDIADLPFALLYLYEDDGKRARLAGSSGLDFTAAGRRTCREPRAVDDPNGCPWPLIPAAEAACLPDAARRLASMGATCRMLAPNEALVMPIVQPGQERPYGALVAGISPRLALEDTYRGYFDLVAGHLATALSSARAYEEERRRAEALAEIDRAKTAFFSNVSHEFRTPLTLLLGPIEDMRADAESMPPHRREQLDLIHRNGLRLLKLVNTLLDFSRIEAGRVDANYAPLDLAALTADLASVFRSLIEKAGLRLVVDCPRLPEAVYVDREMWEKIVLNLLSNAFKFTFEGEITVILRARGSYIELEVRDTGVGIPKAELPNVFARFHRVQGTRSRTYEGSGIGLALVQELVKLHGGTISVTSHPGRGSRFKISLPMGKAHLPADRIQEPRAGASTAVRAMPYVEEAGRWLAIQDGDLHEGHGDTAAVGLGRTMSPADADAVSPTDSVAPALRRILVADDNADMRDYLQRILAGRWQAQSVPNGLAALRLAREELPDLILCDVMMPEMDGLELVRQVRADPRTRAIPVILLSARAGQEAAIEGLEAGADDYLVKPFSARELEARVASHLELARLRQQAVRQAAEQEAILNSMTDAVFAFDATGTILHMNASARTLLGDRELPDIGAPDSVEAHAKLGVRDEHGQPLAREDWPRSRVLRGEVLTARHALDIQMQSTDGADLHLNVTGAPFRDASGRIVGGIVVWRDVTERRRLERRTQEALEALLAMAEMLVHTADDTQPGDPLPAPTASRTGQRLVELTRQVTNCWVAAVVTLDPDTLQMAPVAVVGLSPEHEAAWWADVPHTPLNSYYDRAVVERVLARETVLVDLTEQPLLNEADYGVRRVLIVPMCIGDRIIGVLPIEHTDSRHTYTAADIALVEGIARLAALVIERERLLREREAARSRELALVEANRRMDAFLGIAAHELKTPLTSVRAGLQVIERRLESEGSADEQSTTLARRMAFAVPLLRRSGQTISRLNRIIDDLLDVSRIQEDKLELRLGPCDLAHLVREAVEEQCQLHPGRVVQLEAPASERVLVLGDADRIGQVVTNYLTNALKYSAEEQPVVVGVQIAADQAHVFVRDQGPGLPAAEHARIWERFHRVEGIEVVSGSGIGLGLGLFICRTVVERHGGRVGVESVPGRGATFWFTLPVAPAAAAAD